MENFELYKAILIIKEECQKHGCCRNCPLCRPYGTDMCGLHNSELTPADWHITPPDFYKVFG